MNLRGRTLRAPRLLASRRFAAVIAASALIGAPLVGAAPALAAEAPSVSVSPDTDLDPEGPNTLSVNGEDFASEGPGVYVAVGPAGLFDVPDFHANAELFSQAQWVRSIDTDGSFTQELTLQDPSFDSDGTPVDCIENECGVYTWAAHGSPDRSQDTYTPITFATPADAGDDEGDEEDDGGNGADENAPGDEDDSNDPGTGDDEGDADPVIWEPELQLFDAVGDPLEDSELDEGDVITVRGTGFDPDGPKATRPPITPGDPAGYYVVFGNFAPQWQPSSGAPTDARVVGEQLWALAESVLQRQPVGSQGAIRGSWLELEDDGSFETSFEVSDIDGPETGQYGVYVFPASGAVDENFEIAHVINYSPAGSEEEPENGNEVGENEDEPGDNDPVENPEDAAPAPDKCLAAEDGTLTWGIYESFREYMSRPFVGGSIDTSGVTEVDGLYSFQFVEGNFDTQTKSGVIKYSGSVHFTGHNGELDVKFANPQLHIKANQATLLLDVTTDGALKAEQAFATVDLAAAQQNPTSFSVKGAETVLTNIGSVAMQDFYKEGEVIDSLTASFALNGAGECADSVITTPNPGGAKKPSTDTGPVSNAPNSQTSTETETEVDTPMCRATTSATLTWGVKQSFADYVTGPIAAGSIGTANGVTGSFNWPGRASTYNPDTGTGQLSFGGTVNFTGHEGALNMRISNPRVQILDGSQARLFADVRSTNPAGDVTVDASGVHIANLNVSGKKSMSGDTVTFSAVPATLTAAGVPAFAEFYDAGSSLDALSMTITLGPEVPCADVGSGTDSLPRTGGNLELAGAGIVFLLLGASAAAARRRLRVTA